MDPHTAILVLYFAGMAPAPYSEFAVPHMRPAAAPPACSSRSVHGPTGKSAQTQVNVDLDPWIFSAGLGYRFNLEDIFGRRAELVALK